MLVVEADLILVQLELEDLVVVELVVILEL